LVSGAPKDCAYGGVMVFHRGAGLKPLRVATRLASLLLVLAAFSAVPVAGALARARLQVRPIVVELFTAQGCVGCPQANRLLGEVAQEKGVIALTYPVDYWDYLGWKDTFAMPEFTARQRAYVARLKLREIYTPEAVVGGRAETQAGDRDRLAALMTTEAKSRPPAPAISFLRGDQRVAVGRGFAPRGGAEVWLVVYDPMRRDVRVRTGENAGKVVTHVNLVRGLTRLGPWTGRPRTYPVPAGTIQPN
jgi:hypothetical protein